MSVYLDSDEAFDAIYSKWPSQIDKAATKTAFNWVSGKYSYSPTQYVQAVELQLQLQPNIRLKLGDWLRDESFTQFIKLIEASGGYDRAKTSLEEYKEVARTALQEWNRVAKTWWAKVEDLDSKVGMFVEAMLGSDYFAANWHKAMLRASRIFIYPYKDELGEVKLRPSIEWFLLNATKIMEGHFGHPEPKTVIPNYEREELTPEDKDEIGKMFQEFKEKVINKNQWQAVREFTRYVLTYKGKVIKAVDVPMLKEDREAAFNDLKNEAALFNKQGYEPSLEVEPPVEPNKTEAEELADKYGLFD